LGRATDRKVKGNITGWGVKTCAGTTTTPPQQTLFLKKVRYD